MSELRFAEPEWVHLLWGVAAFTALLFWLDRRGSSALDRLVGAALRSRLLRRPPAWRRRLRIALLGLAAACAVLALMRPQWGLRYVATPRVGAEIMIALDVSRSMLAEDVAPSRLERAKAEIADLLSYLDGDQVGLIAFSGRATVLSPLTPDFGFLRLALDPAGPHSVTRGGTRLEEPIRKAVAGFRGAGDAQRAILLITDGEDHDSFALDAAKEAAEQGIKIIAIGFGDESGSEIPYTDPRTGARTLLRDADGRVVRSRLDGDLLRDLAFATGGAYVPAGTGVLDLESIYEQHIARLTRGQLDPRGRAVHDEGYQWAVLLAIVLLTSSAALSAGPAAVTAVALLVALGPLAGGAAHAQEADPPATPASPVPDGPLPPEPADTASEAEAEAEAPRAVYNRGVALLADDPEQSARLFADARSAARGDGELRRVASYNLGMAAAARADAFEVDDPGAALGQLQESASWFRAAVGLGDEDARHNLEVVLRRALLLSDRLAAEDEGDFEARLAALAGGQRDLVQQLAGMMEALAARGEADGEGDRRVHRRHATVQRTLLADADTLAERIGAERDALEARPEEERTPEDAMRASQLGNVLHYLHRARERMGQTRRQLRLRQGGRAYRRSSAALAELKRAEDQLRDPVAILDRLLSEELRIASSTVVLAAADGSIAAPGMLPDPPVWLTVESVEEDQRSVAERTTELRLRLEAGLEQELPPDAPAEAAAQLEAVAEAQPFVVTAAEALLRASDQLAAGAPGDALEPQRGAVMALGEARERFLDLRGLLELTAGESRKIDGLLRSEDPEVQGVLREYAPDLRESHARNLTRAGRLAEVFDEEETKLGAAGSGGGGGPEGVDPEQAELARQRMELAAELLDRARKDMAALELGLADDGFGVDPAALGAARESSGRAVESLEALRRLFFSIVEHVRELRDRQVELADATRDAAALAAGSPDEPPAPGPLGDHQGELAEQAARIALELEEQSNREGGVVGGEADPEESSRRLRLAGEHVLVAEGEMTRARGSIEAEEPGLVEAGESQALAVQELEQALALLVPPEQQRQQQQQQDQQQQQGQQQPQPQPQPSEEEAGEGAMDPAQLLQAVRDREAERRRERAGRKTSPYETVERDW
ncbi:MAG: VWA domain-containing protein [Myxococcota bacterium]|nr:VWA domain-containing protein [Myxococcota bacterium]